MLVRLISAIETKTALWHERAQTNATKPPYDMSLSTLWEVRLLIPLLYLTENLRTQSYRKLNPKSEETSKNNRDKQRKQYSPHCWANFQKLLSRPRDETEGARRDRRRKPRSKAQDEKTETAEDVIKHSIIPSCSPHFAIPQSSHSALPILQTPRSRQRNQHDKAFNYLILWFWIAHFYHNLPRLQVTSDE